jgi:Copper amine oxidase, enzyme domain
VSGIHPGISNIHMVGQVVEGLFLNSESLYQTNLKSKRTERNVNFAKHHFAVSRRKDSEPSSSSMWNINLPGNPRSYKVPSSLKFIVDFVESC